MADPPLPNLTDRIDRYLAIWESVGDAEFTIDSLRRVVDGRDGHPVAGSDGDLEADLETLVAAGLLDWHGEDRYQIRLTPEDSLEEWLETTAARTTLLYETIDAVATDRAGEDSDADERDVVRFEGEQYVRTTVSPATTFEDVVADLTELIGPTTEQETAVLCTPADEADHVQRIADSLCDAATMADYPDAGRYEKVTTQVLGSDPDDLEYRMYLARRDDSTR